MMKNISSIEQLNNTFKECDVLRSKYSKLRSDVNFLTTRLNLDTIKYSDPATKSGLKLSRASRRKETVRDLLKRKIIESEKAKRAIEKLDKAYVIKMDIGPVMRLYIEMYGGENKSFLRYWIINAIGVNQLTVLEQNYRIAKDLA